MKTLSNWLMALACFSAITVTSTAQAEMQLEPGTSVLFSHHDLLGSPVMVSDHKGRTIWYENTAPYGKNLGKQSSGGVGHLDNLVGEAVSEVGYTGHTVDNTTGLVYMKARHYDPVIGRFYSNDPIGFLANDPVTFNRYSYVGNDPYNYTDPTGEAREFSKRYGVSINYPLLEGGDSKGMGGGPRSSIRSSRSKTTASDGIKRDAQNHSLSKEPLKAGDRGTQRELANKRRRNGQVEKLEIDHQPTIAAQIRAAENRRGGPLSTAEREQLRRNTPAVASPVDVHAKSTTWRGRNTQSLINKDAANLKKAEARDSKKFDSDMKERKE